VYEEIDNEDIHTPVPHLNGTIVCKFDFSNWFCCYYALARAMTFFFFCIFIS
jgi:hypothetical protein